MLTDWQFRRFYWRTFITFKEKKKKRREKENRLGAPPLETLPKTEWEGALNLYTHEVPKKCI